MKVDALDSLGPGKQLPLEIRIEVNHLDHPDSSAKRFWSSGKITLTSRRIFALCAQYRERCIWNDSRRLQRLSGKDVVIIDEYCLISSYIRSEKQTPQKWKGIVGR